MFKARKNVHHIVLEALNSNDEVEVQAAIHAVTEFAKVSQSFNSGAIGVIAAILQVRKYISIDFIILKCRLGIYSYLIC